MELHFEIIQAFDEFAIRESNETFERYKINSRKQEDDEHFHNLYAALSVFGKTCNFCDSCIFSMIRDQIVYVRHRTVRNAARTTQIAQIFIRH